MLSIAPQIAQLKPSIIREMNQRRRPTSIDLSLGQPALQPDAGVLQRAQAKLLEQTPSYTLNAGLAPLRAKIAAHHGLPGRGGAEHVILTVGSEQALYLALMTTLGPGDEVLIPLPGYPAYPAIVRMLGGVPVPYLVDQQTGLVPRADAIAPLINERTRGILLNSPSNPFGQVTPADELRKIAALCERHQLTLFSDEVYRELVYEGSFTSPCAVSERGLLIGSLSKSCALTGLRVGYLIGDASFMQRATLAHQMMVTCASRFGQLIAQEVFEAPEVMRAHLPYYEAARAQLSGMEDLLPKQARLSLGQGAFYAVLDVSAWAAQGTLQLALQLLEEEDVVVVPGVAFSVPGTPPEASDWFIRLSYAAGAEVVAKGFERVARFLHRAGSQ